MIEEAAESGVGIVVVSHSRPLARAAVALAAEMVHGRPFRVAVAAGLDEATFGTDATRIRAAIQEVDGPDGVLVLMDLGSAVLSAELALDLLDSQAARERVILCPAPLVEGLVVAAVAAASGAGAEEVAAEARSALMGKAAHLGADSGGEPSPVAPDTASDVVAVFAVDNEHGLHARPAARLVSTVRGLDAVVTIRNLTTGGPAVTAASLSRVATLAALRGHELEISARGPQAQDAVDHVLGLAKRRFDESAPATPGTGAGVPSAAVTGPDARSGPQAASPGIGIGPLSHLAVDCPDPDEDPLAAAPAPTQWRRVVEALADVRREVERLRSVTARSAGPAEAGIFDAHLMLLDDSELMSAVRRQIRAGAGAAQAWAATMEKIEAEWAGLPDPYLRARAEDVHAVGEAVLRRLLGVAARRRAVSGVLVARTVTPADVAELTADLVKGIVLANGSATSHVAILARAKGIPAVVGAGPDVLRLDVGTCLIVDGTTGRVLANPSASVLAGYRERAARLAAAAAKDLAEAARPAITCDGTLIHVVANIGAQADARASVSLGADGVGLLRTEFLFQGRDRAPDVDEQERVYRSIAAALDGRPMVVRTLDVGGDKPLQFLPLPREDNPFLGVRGIRVGLGHPSLLAGQLEAILRTAADHPVSVMFPMVTTVDEMIRARELLDSVPAGSSVSPRLRIGMMVEVPAVAVALEPFLPYLDFVSIGTNDLTQYTLAVERGNASVAALFDALHPAVLRLVAAVCRAAAGRIPVAVCGEVASDPAAIPLLLGLGVTELSVSPPAVPGVKRLVRRQDLRACADLAGLALNATGPADVRALVAETVSVAAAAAEGS